MLSMYTGPHGIAQSDGKLQSLIDLTPESVRARAELMGRLGGSLSKRVARVAVHLGCVHALQGESRLQVQQRLGKAANVWYSFQHLWGDFAIDLKWQCLVFFGQLCIAR